MRWVMVLAAVVAAAGVIPPAFAQDERGVELDLQAPRRAEVTIVFHSGSTFGEGMMLGVHPVSALVPEDLAAARFVDIRVCGMPHVFAVAQMAPSGQPLASTTLTVRSGTMTLAEVVAALDEACAAEHLSVTAHELGANALIVPAAVTPAPLGERDLTGCPDGSVECDVIVQKMEGDLPAE